MLEEVYVFGVIFSGGGGEAMCPLMAIFNKLSLFTKRVWIGHLMLLRMQNLGNGFRMRLEVKVIGAGIS